MSAADLLAAAGPRRQSTFANYPATQDNVMQLYYSTSSPSKEAFGINGILHKRRIDVVRIHRTVMTCVCALLRAIVTYQTVLHTPKCLTPQNTSAKKAITPAEKLAAEHDRFHNGLAEQKARASAQALVVQDSASVAEVLQSIQANAAATPPKNRNNPGSPSSARRGETTSDIRDAVRTSVGLLLPEPQPYLRGSASARAHARDDHLQTGLAGLTTADGAEVDISPGAGATGRRHSMHRDQISSETQQAMLWPASTTARTPIRGAGADSARSGSGKEKSYGHGLYGLHSERMSSTGGSVEGAAETYTRYLRGSEVASLLTRNADEAAPSPAARRGHDDDDSCSTRTETSRFQTTYQASHTGAPLGSQGLAASPPRRRYYGGARSSPHYDIHKPTSIY